MRKFFIGLMIVALLCISIPTSVFAVFTAANVGPTTDFAGDINIPSGKSYYINSTLLALSDITTAGLISEAMLDGVDEPADEDILTYEVATTNFEWHTVAELGLQTAITGTDTHVMFFDGANTPAGEAGMTYDKAADALTTTTFVGALTGNATTCTTASAGDAAVDFFGAGVDAVTDETTCTDIEGDLLSITTSVLNATIPADHITADMITTVNCGTNCTWDATNDEVDIDDVFLLLAGDIASGIHDFGGATSFELPNSATPTLTATGAVAYDTTVDNMTNGCLAYKDAATINYVVSLAVGDIWSDDDFVVAYDAEGDKFYMKADATSAGNWVLHLMDVDAADADYVHGTINSNTDSFATIASQPDYGRNITVTGAASASGTVTVTGTTADGTVDATDPINIADGATTQGVKAFVHISALVTTDIAQTCTVGIGDLIGLPNSVDGATDVYQKTVDGVDEWHEISGNINTTNNTLNCATIAQNEDITIYYHN